MSCRIRHLKKVTQRGKFFNFFLTCTHLKVTSILVDTLICEQGCGKISQAKIYCSHIATIIPNSNQKFNITCMFKCVAQENPIIKESQRVKLSDSPTESFPSLLELSARTIICTQINEWRTVGAVPTHLAGQYHCVCNIKQ